MHFIQENSSNNENTKKGYTILIIARRYSWRIMSRVNKVMDKKGYSNRVVFCSHNKDRILNIAENTNLDGIILYDEKRGFSQHRLWLNDLESHLQRRGMVMPPTLIESYRVTERFSEYLDEKLH